MVARAGERLGLGIEATIVALAGPTGAGKSSLFNAVAGEELVTAGHLRPTTSATTAAIWGDVGEPLLDWLAVQRRHRRPGGPEGLILLDLPDFDSVQVAHRAEVERVVALADLMVWVVDPQKYADATLHEHYLRRFSGHGETMLVVLNQADRLDAQGTAACVADLGRLLAADGLPGLPVLALSARTGDGLAALREVLDERVAAREAATARLAADVGVAAAALRAGTGDGAEAGGIGRTERAALTAALADAAGVPVITRAVGRTHRRSGALATGWPFARWLRRFGPDPLRRLRLGAGTAPGLEAGSAPAPRSSLPEASPVQRAQVETAARALADRAAGDLPAPWPALARRAALAGDSTLPARLDAAVSGTDLKLRTPRWWRLAGLLQLLLASRPERARCGSSRSPGSATSGSTTWSPLLKRAASRSRRCCSAAASWRGSCSRSWPASRCAPARGDAPASRSGRCGRGWRRWPRRSSWHPCTPRSRRAGASRRCWPSPRGPTSGAGYS